MGVIAGIDEAGYGPLLGPLVVAVAAFEIDRPLAGDDPAERPPSLWARLGSQVVRKEPPSGKKARLTCRRLIVCDSKKLFAGRRGLDQLERTALCFMASACATPLTPPTDAAAAGTPPHGAALFDCDAETLLGRLGVPPLGARGCPWLEARSPQLPLVCFRAQLRARLAMLHAALERSATRCLLAHPVVVHPRAFNRGVRRHGNKHAYEWHVIARLIRVLWERYGKSGVDLSVDRLSGRVRYGPGLARCLAPAKVVAERQDESVSQYRVRDAARRMRVRFAKGADGHSFAAALASVCAKYMREVFMEPLNGFFAERLPGLRPTAGYAQDGRRFLREIEPVAHALSIEREALVRCC